MEGISLKKSILMLMALFMLGACSTADAVDEDKYQFTPTEFPAVNDAILSTIQKFDIQTTGATQYIAVAPGSTSKSVYVYLIFKKGDEFTIFDLIHWCPVGEDSYVSSIYVTSWTASLRDLTGYTISGIATEAESGNYYNNTTTLAQKYYSDTWKESTGIYPYSYYKIEEDGIYFYQGIISPESRTGTFVPFHTNHFTKK